MLACVAGVDLSWHLLVFVGCRGPMLACVGRHWPSLACVGLRWLS